MAFSFYTFSVYQIHPIDKRSLKIKPESIISINIIVFFLKSQVYIDNFILDLNISQISVRFLSPERNAPPSPCRTDQFTYGPVAHKYVRTGYILVAKQPLGLPNGC